MIFDPKSDYLPYFLSIHILWILKRTVSLRWRFKDSIMYTFIRAKENISERQYMEI